MGDLNTKYLLSNKIDIIYNGNNHILINNVYDHYVAINLELKNRLLKFDGSKSFEEVFDDSNDKESLIKLLDMLLKYGVFCGHEEMIIKSSKPSYLKLSFSIFKKKFLNRILPFFGLFFHKIFIIFFIFFISILFFYVFYRGVLDTIFNIEFDFIIFILLMFINVLFHEFGHASAARYFGATPGEIGGGFYLLAPVYYTDITDIWRLNKLQRIIVNLSGIYFEFILLSMVLLFSLIFNLVILTNTSIICMLLSLNNLNPFVRSDGYWIISDLTNTPNLFKNFNQLIKKIKDRNYKFTFIEYFTFFYGLISYSFIAFFTFNMIIFHNNLIFDLPSNIYKFLISITEFNFNVSFILFAQILLPVMLFYLILNFLKNLNYKLIFRSIYN